MLVASLVTITMTKVWRLYKSRKQLVDELSSYEITKFAPSPSNGPPIWTRIEILRAVFGEIENNDGPFGG